METTLSYDSVDYNAGRKFDVPFSSVKTDCDYQEKNHYEKDAQVFQSVKKEFKETDLYPYYEDALLISENVPALQDEFSDSLNVKTDQAVCEEYKNFHRLMTCTNEQYLSDFQNETISENISGNNELVEFSESLEDCYSESEKDTITEKNTYYRAYTTSDGNLYTWSNANSSLHSLSDTNGEDSLISPVETVNSQGYFSKPDLRVILFDCMSQNDSIKSNQTDLASQLRNNFSPKENQVEINYQALFGKLFHCNVCSSNFNTKNLLQEHIMLVHKTRRPFTCDKSFVTSNWRPNFMSRNINNLTSHNCEVCVGHFGTKCNFNDNDELNLKNRDLNDEDIYQSLSSNEQLASLLPSTYKKFICRYCSNKFYSRSVLKVHMKIHAREKFAWKNNLKSQRIMDMENHFTCEVCFLSFKTKLTLLSHSKIHRIWRSYNCKVCSLQFPQKKMLDEHAKNHCSQALFHCILCSMNFETEELHRIHVKMNHIEKYKCLLCNTSFSTKRSLRKHVYFELKRLMTTLEKLRTTVQSMLDEANRQ